MMRHPDQRRQRCAWFWLQALALVASVAAGREATAQRLELTVDDGSLPGGSMTAAVESVENNVVRLFMRSDPMTGPLRFDVDHLVLRAPLGPLLVELLEAVIPGTHLDRATVVAYEPHPGAESGEVAVFQLVVTEAVVLSGRVAATSADTQPMAEVTVAFGCMVLTTFAHDETGAPVASETRGFDSIAAVPTTTCP